MKHTLTLIILFVMTWSVAGQVVFEEYESRQLNSTRQLKIKLPDNYDPESELKHPVIVVFDGEYLFGPVSGQVSFQTYFDEMPESIIVGVYQGKERFYDSFYDEVSGLPFDEL